MIIYPLEYVGITQGFIKSGKSQHLGIDLGWNLLHGGIHAKVYACADGIVHSIQKQNTGGNVLIIKHTINGRVMYSEYGHLEDGSIKVKVGQRVYIGEWVANMGNTGYVNGKRVPYHLHFGIYVADLFDYSKNDWIDPVSICYLAGWQSVAKDTEKEYHIKKISDIYTSGVYKCLYNMNIRKRPTTNSEVVTVKECTNAMKPALVYKNPNDRAVIKKDTKITILEVIKDQNSYWGKNYSGYVCIDDGTNKYLEYRG